MRGRVFAVWVVAAWSLVGLEASQGPPPLTLGQALSNAEAANPSLKSADFEVHARAADAAQASRRLNPGLVVDLEDIGGVVGSSRPSQTTVSLTQRIELGGKRPLRVGVADLERELAAADLAQRRVHLQARVAQAFVDLWQAESEVVLARQDADTALEVSAAVSARVNAGVAAPPEGDRAAAAAALARITIIRSVERRQQAAARLAATWGGAASDVGPLITSASAVVDAPPLGTYEEQIGNAPFVVAAATELRLREQRQSQARAAGVPDLDVSAGYRRLHPTGDNAWVAGASVALPFADRGRDRTRAAGLRVEAASVDVDGARLHVREALAVAHATTAAARAALVEFDAAVLPVQERAYTAVLEGYQAGRFGVLEVLEARRAFGDARRLRQQSLAEWYRAWFTLQTTLGVAPAWPGLTAGGDR